mgnify:CR=1 FL=1
MKSKNSFCVKYKVTLAVAAAAFIAGVILFYLGSGPVKGFAVTLCVGLATSFFTAFTVNRLMVGKYIKNNKDKLISF